MKSRSIKKLVGRIKRLTSFVNYDFIHSITQVGFEAPVTKNRVSKPTGKALFRYRAFRAILPPQSSR